VSEDFTPVPIDCQWESLRHVERGLQPPRRNDAQAKACAYGVLLGEGNERIDLRCAARRQRARHERNGGQDDADQQQHDGVGRRHAEQLTLERAAKQVGADSAGGQTGSNEQQPLTEDELKHRPRRAAEGNANTDFLRPLRHEIREHSVDANRGQKQRDEAKGD